MAPPAEAILMKSSIWTEQDGHYPILRRYCNGVVVGQKDTVCLAIHHSKLKGTRSLCPVVGKLDTQGWIYPNGEEMLAMRDWLHELAIPSRLDWERRLQAHIEIGPRVKVAIEDWSIEDLAILKLRGWIVGFSAAAPLWRIYAVIPQGVWDGTEGEMPLLNGQVRSVQRFGAILHVDQHRLNWR